MVLKISKTTPRCTNRLPGGEHTWVGLNSPVINTPGWWLLGVFGISLRAGFKKNFLVTNRPGSQDSHVYWSWGCLDSLAYFVPAGFFCKPIYVYSLVYSSLGSRDSLVNTPRSYDSPVVNNKTGSLDSTVVNTMGSQLQIRITPRIFSKNAKSFLGMSTGTRRSCRIKKRFKNLVTLSLKRDRDKRL